MKSRLIKPALKRALACLLSICLLLGTLAVLTCLPVAADDNIVSNTPVKLHTFDEKLSAGHRQAAGDLGIHMSMGAPFNGFDISMPTYSTTDSEANVGIYRWDTDYETTIAADPLYTKRFAPLTDNAHNALTFDELPAGEYFIRIYDIKGSVGVWCSPKTVSQGYTYINGGSTEIDWHMVVYFTKTPNEPFLPVKSPEEIEAGKVYTPPAEYVIPEDSLLHTHKVMPDTWVFTDGLGRVSLTNADVGNPREDRTLAMFYWTWHADLAHGGATNTTELMKEHPDAKNDYNHSAWAGTGHYCFWNEPIYGFYRTDDAWVLRRQAELLANAGVDTIFTDNTNDSMTWRTSYMALYETWDDAQRNGAVNVPKVSYLLPFGANEASAIQVNALFNDIYRPGKYQNLWYYLDGKPMLIAHNGNIAENIKNYFTWRGGQPLYKVDKTSIGQWGWLATYPQNVYYGSREDMAARQIEQMTVGVAVNHSYKTDSITAMNGENVMGRSYTTDYPDRYLKEGPSASLWGYQFAEQFHYALERDPKVLFVTGWNEWNAWRQPTPWGSEGAMVNNALVDQFDNEHSRDLEPTKGELKDHYYYQFVNFARQYKGANPIPTPSVNTTIDLSAGADQWKTVEPYYAAYIGNTKDRNAQGYGSLTYTETSGRNDIIGAQVARDEEYVYFHVECAENITAYTDTLWMNLYIDVTGDGALDGWNSFDYVLNKTAPSATTAVLEKFMGNGYASEKVADVAYTVDGRHMTVKIAKSDLGLSGDDYTINFTWTDHVHDEGDYTTFSGDILDFYISGDVAPGGRFKYSYVSTLENSGKPIDIPTETEAETKTETESRAESATDTASLSTEDETRAETRAETPGGCTSSAIGTAAILLLLFCGGALSLRSKN